MLVTFDNERFGLAAKPKVKTLVSLVVELEVRSIVLDADFCLWLPPESQDDLCIQVL